MKQILPKPGITSKLSLFLLLFVFIFYGTIAMVFLHTQKMKGLTQHIVARNTVLVTISKAMITSLLEMDSNAKKFELLAQDTYRDLFFEEQKGFDENLRLLTQLSHPVMGEQSISIAPISKEYAQYQAMLFQVEDQSQKDLVWIEEQTLERWMSLLVVIRDANQQQIEEHLLAIHEHAMLGEKKGLLGLGLSLAVSFIGVWFISKSIILPLKQLTHGLRTVSSFSDNPEIRVNSEDEFQDLALAYNQMNQELREQESLRADFIATLSHEIRTPLSSIQESVHLMLEGIVGDISEKQKKFLIIADQELTRINGLMDQLMNASILESSENNQDTELINPVPVVEDCIDSLTPRAAKKHIELVGDIHPQAGNILGRSQDLQQVLCNLVNNAIKFSPAETRVTISVLPANRSGNMVLQVEDQGPGIDAQEEKLIFTKYYRSKSVRQHMDGVGLGLYISNKLVRQMRGVLEVKQNDTSGSTFTISLPAA